ncbi:hypothetical protein MMC15_000609 [Xylographa vitiligo]|nr:hypothetical protein [Xylographa vitiligo]
MDLIFTTNRVRFRDKPGIKSSLVNDLKMLRGFPEAVDDYMALTVRSEPSHLNVLAAFQFHKEAKTTTTKGDQFHRQGDYDAARTEYLIALYMATVLEHTDLEPSLLDAMDILYVELRSKMSLLDSEQKRYQSAVVEAIKALRLPRSRNILGIADVDQMIMLHSRWATTLADDGRYKQAVEALGECPVGKNRPVYQSKLEELKLLQETHEA